MKILLTGSQGYIGTDVGAMLTKAGHQVTGLDTGFYKDCLLYPEEVVDIPVIHKDTRNVTEDDLRGFDVLIHMAELSNDPLAENDPKLTYEINHKTSLRLAQFAKKSGVKRFIYMSSCSIYGVASPEQPVDETSPVNPQTAYAKCKHLVEQDVSLLADSSFSPVFLRNATVFGPSPRLRFDLVLNNLMGVAYTTGEIKMVSDGSPWRPIVHVEDIANAIKCIVEADRNAVHGEIFNVGSNDQVYQVKDIAQIVANVLPGCKVTLGAQSADNRSYKVNFDKINKHLPHFRCTKDASIGAQELKVLFDKIHLTKEMFESKSFTRVKQLKYLQSSGFINEKFYWNL